ncbi:Qat anti-phage system TatD family nuclease QatD (plasmid) [Methylomarinum sp. Ch1-1]|uniref:Qat anti-phage system TatD family nuclease QatD n=1 Tax=Methylomarinum roseum TaxID=3067653 RepID=A0AAU7P0Y7_9GAMM
MHCHLDLYPDPFKIIEGCRARGTYVLSVTTTPKAWQGTSQLAEGCQRIRTALGLHPQLAHQRAHEIELFDALLPGTKYVGEIGLDASKGFKDHWDVQLKVFRHILKSVDRAGGRIMSVHSRGSAAAVLDELKGISGLPILHWFTGTPTQLKRAIDMGCWFSVGPAMLATKKGRDLVSIIPKERIVTESDGPFAKVSGKSLFPWDVDLSIKQISDIWKCDERKSEEILTNNFKQLCIKNNSC